MEKNKEWRCSYVDNKSGLDVTVTSRVAGSSGTNSAALQNVAAVLRLQRALAFWSAPVLRRFGFRTCQIRSQRL